MNNLTISRWFAGKWFKQSDENDENMFKNITPTDVPAFVKAT